MKSTYQTALIVGAGDGLSASVARVFAQKSRMRIALAARNPRKLAGLAKELGAYALECDVQDRFQVQEMFARADECFGASPDVVVYNPSYRVRGSILEVDPDEVHGPLRDRGDLKDRPIPEYHRLRGPEPVGSTSALLT